MDVIAGLNHWLDQIALQLEPAQRRELMRRLAQGLRVRMRDRIRQQHDPDGSRFMPRKRDQIGNIKRQGAMFKQLGGRIKTDYSADHAAVGFGGRDGFIARIHQEGRTVRPYKNAQPTRYPRRELVGFEQEDLRWIETQFVIYLLNF